MERYTAKQAQEKLAENSFTEWEIDNKISGDFDSVYKKIEEKANQGRSILQHRLLLFEENLEDNLELIHYFVRQLKEDGYEVSYMSQDAYYSQTIVTITW